jgi:hypothetical protein
MSDAERIYSDDEFALILRKTAELASRVEPSGSSSGGLTLSEMKAAAAQAGLDPALVERAVRMLSAKATESPFERLIGGPLRPNNDTRFPVALDERTATRLLSAVRISASQAGGQDVGHSGSMGMTWHDGGELEALSVTARPAEDSTSVSVSLDRRGTFAVVAFSSGLAIMVALLAGIGLSEVNPALGIGASIVGTGGVLAIARGYWASSTRKVQERISGVMDVIGQALIQPKT